MKADKCRRCNDPFRPSGNPTGCRRSDRPAILPAAAVAVARPPIRRRPIAVSSATYAPAATIPTTKILCRPQQESKQIRPSETTERIDAKHEYFRPPGRAENPLPPAKKTPANLPGVFLWRHDAVWRTNLISNGFQSTRHRPHDRPKWRGCVPAKAL